ncbi:lysophospholipase L1-like esterase/FtsZ-binding cell division protein ZapB [Clostridium beijerinckii]|nr:lysophospholipase L1-like esterase/FtsZ-binding cell division protein ZapB [Clostridium beijerinckii]
MKADQVPLIQEHTGITKDNNIVSIEADEQLTTTAGDTPIELQFIDSTTGKKKATFNLILKVIPTVIAVSTNISKATYTLLEELENKLDQESDFFVNIDEAVELNQQLSIQNTNASSNINNLTTQNNDATNKMSALGTQNNNATPNISSLTTLNAQADANIAAMQSFGDVTQLTQTVTSLKNEVETARGTKLSVGARLDEMNTQFSDLSKIVSNNPSNNISDLITRINNNDITRIKLIGDSITYGIGSSDTITETSNVIFNDGATIYHESDYTHKCWANFFRSYIARKNSNINFVNAGISAKTTYWFNQNKQYVIDNNEDVIFVMLGTNDRFVGNSVTITNFKNALIEFLAYAKSKCKTLVVLSPQPQPEYTDTNDMNINTSLVNYNLEQVDNIIAKVCKENNYNFIYLCKEFHKYCRYTNTNYKYLLQVLGASNNPHPNNAGHELIWQVIQQETGIVDAQKRNLLSKANIGTVTLGAGWTVQIGDTNISKNRNEVTANLVLQGGTTAANTIFGVVPSEFIPSTQKYFSCDVYNGSQWSRAGVLLDTSGNLIFDAAIAGNIRFVCNISYTI